MEGKTLLNCLKRRHRGKSKAVKSHILEARFDITGKELRDIVNALRREAHPICSDESGYYYAETVQEIAATVHQLYSRIAGIAAAHDGLYLAYLRCLRGGGRD